MQQMHAPTIVCSHPKGKPQTLSFSIYFQFRLFIPFLSVLLPLIQVLMAPERGMLGWHGMLVWHGCSLAGLKDTGCPYGFHLHGLKLLRA